MNKKNQTKEQIYLILILYPNSFINIYSKTKYAFTVWFDNVNDITLPSFEKLPRRFLSNNQDFQIQNLMYKLLQSLDPQENNFFNFFDFEYSFLLSILWVTVNSSWWLPADVHEDNVVEIQLFESNSRKVVGVIVWSPRLSCHQVAYLIFWGFFYRLAFCGCVLGPLGFPIYSKKDMRFKIFSNQDYCWC